MSEDFYPFTLGSKRTTVALTSFGEDQIQHVKELSYEDGGVIRTRWLECVGLPNKISLPLPSPKEGRYRTMDGYIDIGMENLGEMQWSPIVKLGAKKNDCWEREIFKGCRELYRLREFSVLELPNDIAPSGKALCAVIEKTMIMNGSEMLFEEITLAEGFGPVKEVVWANVDGKRQQTTSEEVCRVRPKRSESPQHDKSGPAPQNETTSDALKMFKDVLENWTRDAAADQKTTDVDNKPEKRPIAVKIGTVGIEKMPWWIREYNASLRDVKCHAVGNQIVIEFRVDTSKWQKAAMAASDHGAPFQ